MTRFSLEIESSITISKLPNLKDAFMRYRFIALVIITVLLAAACSNPEPTPTPEPAATSTPIPTSTPVPTPTPTPSPPTPGEIYQQVAPSIAFIDTIAATGSGILLDGNFVVTNAHVVWPYNEARIVFMDGSEFEDVPVIGIDWMTDLAVLGPIETELAPLPLTDGEQLAIGDDVYLVGFPGEVDAFPQPALTRGLISVFREWDSAEITYFQSDADIAGGQSGGAFVSAEGDVIGISGFGFTEADFALVASTKDLEPYITQLIDGENVFGLGDRRYESTGGGQSARIVLENEWDSAEFVLYPDLDETFEITLDGSGDGAFELFNQYGESLIYADEEVTGQEVASVDAFDEPPYFLHVTMFETDRSSFTVSSNTRLIDLNDPDDYVSIAIGDTLQGSIDYPSDRDLYTIELERGDELYIKADSALVDAFLTVSFPGADLEDDATDDDSGGGLFGLSSELTYRATRSGEHLIVVESALIEEVGGYILSVEMADE